MSTTTPSTGAVGDAPDCPYVGLVPFSEGQADYFFGREDDSEIIALNAVSARLVFLYAPSGVGKTSVLRAGVLPRMRAEAASDPEAGIAASAVVYVGGWADDPVATVISGVRDALGREHTREPDTGESLTVWLHDALRSTGAPWLYLILDQFEEYFQRHPVEDGLARQLHEMISTRDLPLHVLLAARDDAIAGLDRFESRTPGVFANRLQLAHLSREAARVAIEGPLGRYNLTVPAGRRVDVEPGLVATLLEQVRTGQVDVRRERAALPAAVAGSNAEIEAPYLQLVLTRLWDDERKHGSTTLRAATLHKLGGAQSIVENHLDDVIAALGPERTDLAAAVLRQLVTPSGTKIALSVPDLAGFTKRPADDIEELLEELSKSRWRTVRPVSPAAGHAGPPRYEIFHDVMCVAVLAWLREHDDRAARRELAQARSRLGRARLVAVVWALLFVLATVLGLLALDQSRKASSALRLAQSKQLAAEADRVAGTHPDTAILLGLQSLSLGSADAPRPPVGLIAGLARFGYPSSQLATSAGSLHDLAVSSDGNTIAIAGDNGVQVLWGPERRPQTMTSSVEHRGPAWSVAFNPDGTMLAAAYDDGSVILWDIAANRLQRLRTRQPVSHVGPVWSVAFSTDGRQLASAGADGIVRLWDVVADQPLGQLTGHAGGVRDVAFSRETGLLATAGDDQTIRIWNTSTYQPVGQPLNGGPGRVLTVTFSPDGRLLAAGGESQTVSLWDTATGNPTGPPLAGHTSWVRDLAFSPDGTVLASVSDDQTVRLWEPRARLPRGLPLLGHTGWVQGVAFSQDGTLLDTAGADGAVRQWSLREPGIPTVTRTLTPNADQVDAAAFSPDSRTFATAHEDGTVQLWDAGTAQPRRGRLVGHQGWVWSVAFSPDGRLLATSGSDATVRLWDTATGQQVGDPMTGHNTWVRDVAFSPDGTLLASAGDDRSVRLWDVATRRQVGELKDGHTSWVSTVAFDPSDKNTLVTGSDDRTIVVWDLTTGQPRYRFAGHSATVTDVAFKPGSSELASSSVDQTVRFWDTRTGRPVDRMLVGHTSWVSSVAYSPDGRFIATAGDDRSVRIWDADTGVASGEPLIGHSSTVWAAVFSPDGRYLVSVSRDTTVQLWNRSFRDWVSAGCGAVNHNLSIAEWERVLPGVDYEKTCPSLPPGDGAPNSSVPARYPPPLSAVGPAGDPPR